MRKIIMFNSASLDGFFEGPGGDISWHNANDEFNAYGNEQMDRNDGLLFGRITYGHMVAFWPTPQALAMAPEMARRINAIPKIVFSRTLDRADWNNTRIVRGDAAEEVARLRQQDGRPLCILGSGSICAALTRARLIDEYHVMITPVLLGRGTPLFQGVDERLQLNLLESRQLKNGNILAIYAPA